MTEHVLWVDLDDVLAHTIEGLVELLQRDHDRRVDVEDVLDFDLADSFGFDAAELSRFFDRAHSHEELHALAPVAGAGDVLRGWHALGFEVHVVTGRPPICAAASKGWLEAHDMSHHDVHFVDKYGRPAELVDGVPFVPVERMLERAFTWAVEDSLEMAIRLARDACVPVALVDRPWNRAVPELPAEVARRIVRCHDWQQVQSFVGRAEIE